MKCPACSTMNSDEASRCICGYNLTRIKPIYRSFTNMGVQEFFFNCWRTYGVAWQTFLLLFAIYAVLNQGLQLGAGVVPEAASWIIRFLALTLTTMAITVAAHRASEWEVIDVVDSYVMSLRLFGPYVWTWALYSLIVLGGLLLFIIPGLIWGVLYILAPYAVIIDGTSGRAALSASRALTEGKNIFIYVFGFGVLFFLVISIPLFLVTLLVGVMLGDPMIGFIAPKPEWARVIGLLGQITHETLFIVFNVLLYKSLRKIEGLSKAPS